ncbi:MAG: hypothetical protein RR857_17145 [Comamonas sp.]
MTVESSSPRHWETILESIDLEIAQLAIVCRIRLLDPGVIERVIDRNDIVCGHKNPQAFEKLRALLIMHFTARESAAHELGDEQASAITAHIRAHLGARVGDQLGTPRP